MSAEYLAAWALCMVAACVVITVVSVIAALRHCRRSQGTRPEPRTPAPAAAVVVHPHDPAAFEEFLAELIVTPHVEEALR